MDCSFQEISLMAQLIEACQQRGAFKAQEMVAVGSFYQKLMKCINKNKETAPPEDSKTPPAKTNTPLESPRLEISENEESTSVVSDDLPKSEGTNKKKGKNKRN